MRLKNFAVRVRHGCDAAAPGLKTQNKHVPHHEQLHTLGARRGASMTATSGGSSHVQRTRGEDLIYCFSTFVNTYFVIYPVENTKV
jgi:hypothetical protein